MPERTEVRAKVVRVVGGDSLRVRTDAGEENLRLFGLDTEKTRPGGDGPVTPWGLSAKKEAQRFFEPGDRVTLAFPGPEPEEICWQKYRGDYGRPLAFVYKNGVDYQEHMIRRGYSPYFMKYGYVPVPAYHTRYAKAERAAQSERLGVWDQVGANGSETRNYALLTTWWHLRARIIDDYRRLRRAGAYLLNTRLDYAEIADLARQEKEATVFTELRGCSRAGGTHLIVDIGSVQQPFKVFVPDVDSPEGEAIVELLDARYIARLPDHPRRSYAYVTGAMKLLHGTPEIIVASAEQITDEPPAL